MTDPSLLDSDGRPLPLPPDPLSPVPGVVENELAAYRAGDVARAREALTALAGTGRSSTSGHAAMALAGIEISENGLDGSDRLWLEQVAAGEDPWLGPLATVMLNRKFRSAMSSDVGRQILASLASQLTGATDAARDGFAAAFDAHKGTTPGYVAGFLLGNLLIQSGDQDAALRPLSHSREGCNGTFAAYAGHLESHVLMGQNEVEPACEVLSHAYRSSHPVRGGDEGLHPWVALRFGELLAGQPCVDFVQNRMERRGVSEGEVIRKPFESANGRQRVSAPALADLGLFLFFAEFKLVHAALERLREWSDERYERGRRLVLALHTFVKDSGDAKSSRSLARLLTKLELPTPKY
ncbi:hypothetical protein AB0L06_03975 [Spirillospora sp. NPDC052269]